jgi:hypothetical protein
LFQVDFKISTCSVVFSLNPDSQVPKIQSLPAYRREGYCRGWHNSINYSNISSSASETKFILYGRKYPEKSR